MSLTGKTNSPIEGTTTHLLEATPTSKRLLPKISKEEASMIGTPIKTQAPPKVGLETKKTQTTIEIEAEIDSMRKNRTTWHKIQTKKSYRREAVAAKETAMKELGPNCTPHTSEIKLPCSKRTNSTTTRAKRKRGKESLQTTSVESMLSDCVCIYLFHPYFNFNNISSLIEMDLQHTLLQAILFLTAFAGILYLCDRYFSGSKYKGSIPDLKGKFAVVTGGNSGIGAETVKMLARKGCDVMIGARDQKRSLTIMEELKK